MPVEAIPNSNTNHDLNTASLEVAFTPIWIDCLDYTRRTSSELLIGKYLYDESVFGPFISGYHGVGKTTLATRIVSERRGLFDDIFFIDIPEYLSGGLEELLCHILREIEKFSTYSFDMKNAEKQFLSFVQSKRACFIIDDFNIPICCDFLRFLSFYKVKSKFVLISNRNLNYYQEKLERLNMGRINLSDRFPPVPVSDFSVDEAEILIQKRLDRSGIYSPKSISYIKRKMIEMDIRHPYELVLILSHIEQTISDDNIRLLDDFSLRYSDIKTYHTILKIVGEDWNLISDNSKVLLYFVSFFSSAVDLSYLSKCSETLKRMWDSVLELEKYNLLISIGMNMFTVNTLTKQALDSFRNEEDYEENIFPYYQRARNLWVEICDFVVSDVRDCYDNYALMENVDKSGGIDFVKSVIKWCIEEGRYEIADRIGINASYYCYARGDGAILTDSIEMFRYECAKKLDDFEEMSNALAQQLNISSKRGRLEDAEKIIGHLKKLNYKPERIYSEVRLSHAWAHYHLANKNYDEAYRIWYSLYLRRSNLRPMDVGTVSRWLSECMRQMNKPNEEILDILRGSLQSAKEHNATRDLLQCMLQITEIQVSSGNITYDESEEFLQLEKRIKDLGDPSCRARFYFLKYRVALFLNKPELAKQSLILAKKNYDTIFNARMSSEIDDLIKKC